MEFTSVLYMKYLQEKEFEEDPGERDYHLKVAQEVIQEQGQSQVMWRLMQMKVQLENLQKYSIGNGESTGDGLLDGGYPHVLEGI